MKAHEEQWEHRGGSAVESVALREPIALFGTLADEEDHESDEKRARLAAAAPEMARLLLEMQWSGNIGQGGYGCSECEAEHKDPRGHHPDCRLLAVLKKAGVLESAS